MNIQSIMAQAQKMQKEIANAKAEIDNKVFVFENDFVLVEFMGSKKLKKIKIKQMRIDDTEVLEDMITIAINECLNQIDKETNERLGKYSAALNGLM